jgi:hypothetical protein
MKRRIIAPDFFVSGFRPRQLSVTVRAARIIRARKSITAVYQILGCRGERASLERVKYADMRRFAAPLFRPGSVFGVPESGM